METTFDLNRTLQAATHLLKLQPRQQMSALRLVTLLYIADREMLAEHLFLITCDQPVATKKGPVLAQTLDLIRGSADPAALQKWQESLKTVGHAVVLVNDPGHGDLSRAIRKKLEAINQRYVDLDDYDLVDATHQFQEWANHYVKCSDGRFPYPWEEVMAVQGADAEAIAAAQQQESTRQAIHQFFAG
jgi:hypothetical protein